MPVGPNTQSDLDQQQIVQRAFDEDNDALRVTSINGGSFTPSDYDEVDLTYVTVGNGVGQIHTVVYKLATITVGTLTLSYDSNDKLTSVVRS